MTSPETSDAPVGETPAEKAAETPAGMGPPSAGLAPGRRFLAVAATWVLLNLSQPGVLRPDGFGHLAFFALAPWAWAASRPGRRAFLAEWAAHALGLLGWFLWMRHLLPGLLVPMAIVPALYPAFAGVALRRMLRVMPLALAAPLAWTAGELARCFVPVPGSFGWMRTGTLMHDTLWLSGSVRVWGVWGVTFTLGALGALAAQAFDRRGFAGLGARTIGLGLGPLLLAIVLSLVTSAPRTVDGPLVVIAQPGIEQSLKSGGRDPVEDVLRPLIEETEAGLAAAEARHGRAADLVLWGETILLGALADEEVLRAFDDGVRPPEWTGRELSRIDLEVRDRIAETCAALVTGNPARVGPGSYTARQLFGTRPPAWATPRLAGERLLPEGCSFLSGVEAWTVAPGRHGDELRRRNGIVVWDAAGQRGAFASKVHVVPGGESIEPVKYFPPVVEAVQRVGGYVPDFIGAAHTTVLPVATRDGRTFGVGATVCYDNAFEDPYVGAVRRGPVDLFVVASNEAWYVDSPEMDHMVAFSRMRALTTGRSLVRATNSGVSTVIGPDGRAVGELTVDGRRKMVRGHLAAVVPTPADPAARTVWVATGHWQIRLWALLAGLATLAGLLRRKPKRA